MNRPFTTPSHPNAAYFTFLAGGGEGLGAGDAGADFLGDAACFAAGTAASFTSELPGDFADPLPPPKLNIPPKDGDGAGDDEDDALLLPTAAGFLGAAPAAAAGVVFLGAGAFFTGAGFGAAFLAPAAGDAGVPP